LVTSVVALVGAGPALAQPPERVKVLIGFTQQPGPAEQALVHRAGGTIKYSYHLVPAIAATVPEGAIDGLRRNPNVTHVELDLEVHAVEEVLPWGVDRIDAEVVHSGGNTGADVKVAVIDTGIDKDHPDLESNIKGGVNFVAKGPFVNSDAWDDDNGHGTHVAGTIAAVDNDTGVVGVAPQAWLYGVKVLNKRGSGYVSDIMAGIQWAVDNGMQVINMSLGGGSSSDEEAMCQKAYDADLLLVAAAGNASGGDVIYPAGYSSVIAVSATTDTDGLASFSSVGPEVELAAPGEAIYSTYKDGGYATGSGTSMASPHVAGTAALVLAANPGWGNEQVRTQLQTTADDLGPTGPDDYYGYGLVDADEAAPPGPVDEPPTVSITSPADGSTFDSGASILFEGTATDPEDGDLTGSLVWMSSKDGQLGTGGSFSATLSDGDHTITASATDSGGKTGSASINITVTPPQNDPPSVFITSPVDGSPFDSGTGILFEGTASDTEDGDLTTSLVWTSDIDGQIGMGGSFSTILSDGNHTITASVTDSGGNTGSASVSITVGKPPAEATTVSVDSITYATEGGKNDDKHLSIAVALLDNLDNSVAGASVSIDVSLDGSLYASGTGTTATDGTVTFKVPNAPSGTYTTKVTGVTAEGLTWYGDTPPNSFDK